MNWYLKCWQHYADFTGRARRSEYWYFALFNMIVSFVITLVVAFIAGLTVGTIIGYLYALVVFIPGLAVCVRRLHDVGKSGWYYLVSFIPLIGWIWLLILVCTDSQPGTNEWGVNPKEQTMDGYKIQ